MGEFTPEILLYAALAGSLLAFFLVLTAILLLTAIDLKQRMKEDISRRRKVRAFVRIFPKHLRNHIDWRKMQRNLPKVMVIGSIAFTIIVIFMVGLVTIF